MISSWYHHIIIHSVEFSLRGKLRMFQKGHLSYECSNGNTPKPNIFVYNDMLRKTTNGVNTSKVMCSPQTSTKAIWVPKHLLTNPKGPNKS